MKTVTSYNPDTRETSVEPGWKTSEFWLNLAILVLSFVLVLTGHVEAEVFAGAAGLQGAGFSVGRSLRKRS